MANKRKKSTAVVATITAAALLLGGTFAWTSISQQALNESAGTVNVGGRLHDDFDGENKDVYVENFTDPMNGGQPIYARIKLTEYMEVGSEAGKLDDNGDYDANRNAESVVEGATIDNTDSWSIHKPVDDCTLCVENGENCVFHTHWQWEMGNTDPKVFMPTFNKDKDSLDADINGTYHGTDATDKVYYDDYVVYTTDNTADGVGVDIAEDAKEAHDGSIYSVVGTEYYDNDADMDKNDHTLDAELGGYRTETNVTHTAKETATATVMTMQAWIDAGSTPGNYWVYDTDGWAYWANPIMPGEATGLLLSNIDMIENPGEKCYYAINVIGQFATVGDWEYFDGTEENGTFDGTDEAKTLLETVSKNVATVTVTNVSGATLLTPGESYEFSANVTVNGQQVLAASDFEWSVLNADKTVAKSTIEIDADGKAMLKVADDEASKNLIVVAKAINSNYLGALGMCSVAVDVQDQVVFTASFETTDDLSATPYAVVTKIPDSEYYQLSFVRTNETIAENDDTLNDVTIEKVYTVDENTGDIPDLKNGLYDEYDNPEGYKYSNIEFLNTIAPTSTKSWFTRFYYIESITFSSKFNTSKLTTMDNMFDTVGSSDSKLKYVDMSAVDFNGAEVVVDDMFSGQNSLVEVSLPRNVAPTTMNSLFYNCESLETINGLDTWDVSKCTNMSFTFWNCDKLVLDCSGWDVTNVTSHENFTNASGVTLPTAWQTTETETTTE